MPIAANHELAPWRTRNWVYRALQSGWKDYPGHRENSPSAVHGGYATCMSELVSIRDLRNAGGEVVRRVERGERIVVTRDGLPIAELSPLPRRSVSPTELVRRRRNLPRVDVDSFRSDFGSVLDSTF